MTKRRLSPAEQQAIVAMALDLTEAYDAHDLDRSGVLYDSDLEWRAVVSCLVSWFAQLINLTHRKADGSDGSRIPEFVKQVRAGVAVDSAFDELDDD